MDHRAWFAQSEIINFNYATDHAVHDNLITLINFQLQDLISKGVEEITQSTSSEKTLLKLLFWFDHKYFLLMSGNSSHVKNF